MVAYSIRYTESSEHDLLNILRYIANERNDSTIALRMVHMIDTAIESLSSIPHRFMKLLMKQYASLESLPFLLLLRCVSGLHPQRMRIFL